MDQYDRLELYGIERVVFGLYVFLFCAGALMVVTGNNPGAIWRFFLWAAFLLVCNSGIAGLFIAIRAETRAPEHSGIVTDSLIAVVTFLGRIWAWGVDGVMIYALASNQPGATHWMAWNSAAWSRVVPNNVLWLLQQSVVWLLKPWGRTLPVPMEHWSILSARAMNTLGGLWWRYDVSLAVVSFGVAAVLFWLASWEVRLFPPKPQTPFKIVRRGTMTEADIDRLIGAADSASSAEPGDPQAQRKKGKDHELAD
ncbi:MAG: hypothetical protein C7B43_14545 [Sulfobacillus benefaciens]|jgi:hypothetical protein|uniref:Uncharacterized protein n=1 Tax=Sulfobacillus benefaciens TaxID=453960 RepID=A0A2T2WVA4_9FIRM|nr:MAG: hypothetical protein C7B43_14545 [Sulfobacillus benefaciens]